MTTRFLQIYFYALRPPEITVEKSGSVSPDPSCLLALSLIPTSHPLADLTAATKLRVLIPILFQMVLQYNRQDLTREEQYLQNNYDALRDSQTTVEKISGWLFRIAPDRLFIWFHQPVLCLTTPRPYAAEADSQSLPNGIAIQSPEPASGHPVFAKSLLRSSTH